MNKERIELIKKCFEGIGPKLGEAYSNKEMVDSSIALQGAIAKDFTTRLQMDINRDRDVIFAIESAVTDNGLEDTEEFQRLKKNITELGYTIGSFIKGMNGEKIAKRALKLISFDKDVRVLFNIALEHEDIRAEYDAIVITPYGIFVVEVKNWAASMVINERGVIQKEGETDITYDLPGRMIIKEELLREYLGELFTEDYQGIVLFSNVCTKVQDNYKKIPLSFGGSIVYDIREHGNGKSCMSREQIDRIAEILLENNKEQKTISKVDSEAIIADYASVVVMIEKKLEKMAEYRRKIESKTETVSSIASARISKEEKAVKYSELHKDKVIHISSIESLSNCWNYFDCWSVASAVYIILVAGFGALALSLIHI